MHICASVVQFYVSTSKSLNMMQVSMGVSCIEFDSTRFLFLPTKFVFWAVRRCRFFFGECCEIGNLK